MKKICFFVGNLNNSGGTERVSTVIANSLSMNGYHVTMLNLNDGSSPFFPLNQTIANFKLFDFPQRGIYRLPQTVIKLRKFLIENNIDILIDVDSILSFYSIPAIFKTKVNHICWEHFNYNVSLGKKIRKFSRFLAGLFSTKIVVLTEKDKNTWIRKIKCKNKIVTIPNPITIDIKKSCKNKLSKENTILAIGRLTYQKGFDLLLQAWSKINQLYPSWNLKIIGDGEDKKKLLQLIDNLQLQHSVEILPATKNLHEHYEKSSFYVLSSRFEGFGLVILEAQAYGLPVISFNCEAGPSEIIINNETGWLCENGNIFDLSKTLEKAINLNLEKYSNISKASRNNAERFSISEVIKKWLKLLDGL